MSKIIVFSKLTSFRSGFKSFASMRPDLLPLDDKKEKVLYFEEPSALFIVASDFSKDGLYLVFDKISLKDFDSLMSDYDRSEFYVLKHNMPSFGLIGFAKCLDGRHEFSESGGSYYPILVEILSDSQPDKVQRFFDATFGLEETIDKKLNDYFNNLYQTNLGSDYWRGNSDSKKNKLLFWDNNINFETQLLEQMEIAPDDSFSTIQQFKNEDLIFAKNIIVVLLETNYEGRNRSDFYGLELVSYLRKDLRYKDLIIVYSSLTLDEIREQVPGSAVLFTSGIKIFPIGVENRPLTGNELDSLKIAIPAITEELLDDLHYNVFDHSGKIHELLHNLKNELGSLKELNLSDALQVMNDILNFYQPLFLKEIDSDKSSQFNSIFSLLRGEIFQDVQTKLQNDKPISYNNGWHMVNKYANQLASFTYAASSFGEIPIKNEEDWQVLYLEDTKGIRDKVYDYFKTRNVVCHLASNEKEALTLLKQHQHKISVFITDIRLLDENGVWSDRQGYDVIGEVLKQSNYPLVYAVLTSKKGAISKMVQKKRIGQPLWFSKDDVLDNENSFNIFFDIIKSYAANFANHHIYTPEHGPWEKPNKTQCTLPLKLYYKAHKESPDYWDVEESLNKKALEFIDAEEDEKVLNSWMCRMDFEEIDEVSLEVFRNNKLLARRIVLAYLAKDHYETASGIYNKLMRNNEIVSNSSVKGLFNKLAFSTDLKNFIENLKKFDASKGEKAGVLFEELEFLRAEFFINEIKEDVRLDHEWPYFRKFLIKIGEFLDEEMLKIHSPIFSKVRVIARKGGNPSIKLLDEMFNELSDIDEQLDGKLSIQTLKGFTFQTRVINKLLDKYCWQ